jgi:hypothetical protein
MSTFQFDPRAEGEMLSTPEMQAHMRGLAERIAAAAVAIAPVGPGTELEHYKESFHVSSGVRHSFRGKRAYGRVENTSDHAAAIEFSNFRTRKKTIDAQHVLGRSIDAARD